jgi:hypothetical protein
MVTKDQAAAAARESVESRGLPWIEPVEVYRGALNYTIVTNASSIGGTRVVVSRRTGRVVRVQAQLPR